MPKSTVANPRARSSGLLMPRPRISSVSSVTTQSVIICAATSDCAAARTSNSRFSRAVLFRTSPRAIASAKTRPHIPLGKWRMRFSARSRPCGASIASTSSFSRVPNWWMSSESLTPARSAIFLSVDLSKPYSTRQARAAARISSCVVDGPGRRPRVVSLIFLSYANEGKIC